MMKYGKTETFEEALDLFSESTRIVRDVDVGRLVAEELAKKHGTTDGKEVVQMMVLRGQLDPHTKHHWVGSIFCDANKWEKTGEIIKANGHDKLANRWRLKRVLS